MPQSTPPDADSADAAFWRPHRLTITLSDRGLDYALTCPVAEDSSAACHTWREFDEDHVTLADEDDPESAEAREIVHHEETCIAVDWFNYDTRGALEEGYQGPARNSLVSGPINVISCGEDEWLWEYA